MNYHELVHQIRTKKTNLCIGLDTDIKKIPQFLLKEKDPVFTFNKIIIEATHDLCVAYKPNIAFYESMGPKGWESLEKTMEVIPENLFTIADAKRGDIGNTSEMYARTFFEYYQFDAVTVAPYMGEDSVTPFLNYKDKWVIVLGLTSNKGSNDFQRLTFEGKTLYEHVFEKVSTWGNIHNLMFVVGATHADDFSQIRKKVPDHFLLVPGVGAQGGDAESIMEKGQNKNCGLLINVSRDILYAGNGHDFAETAREKTKLYANILSGKISV
ncbi:MAG: orotidine-5'-phosphate decarboxylase [Saprospiraceae bacterium]|nr:orotidine-5'-phosphate decarboxylase [Saprospiraceae bacterium]